MHTQGAGRRGNVMLIAVVVVCAVSLVANVAHYASVYTARVTGHPSATTQAASQKQGTPARGASGAPDLQLGSACLRADNAPTGATFPATDPYDNDMANYGDGSELQRLYAVRGGKLIPHDGVAGVRPCDEQLWEMVTAIAAGSVPGYIDELLIFDADVSNTDPDAFLPVGEVVPQGSLAAHWRLALAPNAGDRSTIAEIVAHEVGHLISLNAGQLVNLSEDDCGTFYTGQGCLDARSFLNRYFKEMWSDTEWKAWVDSSYIDDDKKREAATDKLYDDHQQDFVTRYAATNPIEDFAESFGFWCAFGPDGADYAAGDAGDGADKLDWIENDAVTKIGAQFTAGCDRLRDFAA